MAQDCSGSTAIASWMLVLPSCTYQLSIVVDGVAITNQVAIDNTMTGAQIALLLNSNRIGNTTGTFSVQVIGNDLHIAIAGIVLPTGALGQYSASVSGTGVPCGSLLGSTTFLTCSIIPATPSSSGINLGGMGVRMQQQVCFRRQFNQQGNLIQCPNHYNLLGRIYTKISEDNNKCCYRLGKFSIKK